MRIYKEGSRVILELLETTWDAMIESLDEFPDDFMQDGREQPPFADKNGRAPGPDQYLKKDDGTKESTIQNKTARSARKDSIQIR